MSFSKRHTVKDFMRHDILVAVDSKSSIIEAARKMAQFNVGSVVVLDESGKVIGIFTERDLVRCVANSIDLDSRVEKIMNRNPITIHYDEYIERAVLIMRENNIRHLPVVNKEGKFVGMLSIRDLSKLLPSESLE